MLKPLAAGRSLAWREERLRAARFPRWQFNERGQVLDGLEEVLDILNQDPRLDAWGKILFFLQEKPSLDGHQPLDLLRQGKLREACLAAQAYAESPHRPGHFTLQRRTSTSERSRQPAPPTATSSVSSGRGPARLSKDVFDLLASLKAFAHPNQGSGDALRERHTALSHACFRIGTIGASLRNPLPDPAMSTLN